MKTLIGDIYELKKNGDLKMDRLTYEQLHTLETADEYVIDADGFCFRKNEYGTFLYTSDYRLQIKFDEVSIHFLEEDIVEVSVIVKEKMVVSILFEMADEVSSKDIVDTIIYQQ